MDQDPATVHRWTAAEAGRLDVVVAEGVSTLSRSQAARLVREGRVRVDGETVGRPAASVSAGASLIVEVPPAEPDAAFAEDLPLHVVHEDADVVVVDKAAGMVVHRGAGHASGTLVNALLHHVGDLSGIGGVMRPGIVHRLDRGTSGLMVVAKHDVAHRALQEQFADHSAGRTYLAIVHGVPRAARGVVRSALGRDPTHRMRFASVDEALGKPAVTHWWRVATAAGCSLVVCRLETGRTHQIRVHLAEQGCPLLGDGLYRGRKAVPEAVRDLVTDFERPMLHAWQLRFRHPTTDDRTRWVAPPPADFQAVLDRLGFDVPPLDGGSGV